MACSCYLCTQQCRCGNVTMTLERMLSIALLVLLAILGAVLLLSLKAVLFLEAGLVSYEVLPGSTLHSISKLYSSDRTDHA